MLGSVPHPGFSEQQGTMGSQKIASVSQQSCVLSLSGCMLSLRDPGISYENLFVGTRRHCQLFQILSGKSVVSVAGLFVRPLNRETRFGCLF